MQQQTDHTDTQNGRRTDTKEPPKEHGAIAVSHYHTHSIPLDMEDIERDWDKPITEAGIAAKASVIVRVGLLDLSAGTGSFRVREMMHRIAYPLGVHVRADVNLTDIEAACTDGKDRITEVIDLPTTGVNTERIWLLEHFADWFSVNLGEESMYHTRPEVSKGLMQHLDEKDASQMSAKLAKELREEEKEERERQAEAQEARGATGAGTVATWVNRLAGRGHDVKSGQSGQLDQSGQLGHDGKSGQVEQDGQDAVLDALEAASQHTDPGQPLAEPLDVHESDWSKSAMTESLAERAELAKQEERERQERHRRRGVNGSGHADSEVMGPDFEDMRDRMADRKPSRERLVDREFREVRDAHEGRGRHGVAPEEGFVGNGGGTNGGAKGAKAANGTAGSSSRKRDHKPPKGEYAEHFDHVGKTPVAGRPGITVRQAHKRLDMIEHRKPLYSPAFAGLASAIACASFVFLLGGGPYDMVGAFVGAGLGHWLRRRLFAHHLNQFFVTFVCVAVAALACTGTLRLIGLFDPIALQHDTAYIGAMLFVIPGFPLITSGLDMAKIDFPSGIQRLAYFLCIVLMATLAGWMIATIVHLNPTGFEPLGLNPWVNALLRAVFAFLGVWGFSIMFNSPQRMCLTAAVIGMITDTLRLEIVDAGVPAEAGAFIGALLAGLLASAWRSSVRKGWLPPHLGYPRICLTVPSIVIMVPGMYMYRAMWYLGSFQTIHALDWAFRAFMVIVCLPIGLAMARVITDKSWRYDI
ncbi:membrane protein [Bifidobacterium callitrichos DSM 23973]|uniref:Membrane protein n=2 Tax=Bifidobacterium callitrichos TaxID=762209 RepID=A0A087A0M7_9BIFI|nr:membrane protein [Bifidobacterium callitrichos DSM 23973]